MDFGAFPLALGCNTFGWTSSERESHDVLDAFVAAGGRVLDTAQGYSHWHPGNSGGESEAIIGTWLARRGRRDDVLIATKVSRHPQVQGLSSASIIRGAEDSLRRMQTDVIDLYYAHYDDPDVPLEESLEAFDALIRQGKVRAIAASNHSPERLREALRTSDEHGLDRYIAYQGEYSLVERARYEGPMQQLVAEAGLAFMPYYSLARGFLTGKYRAGAIVDSPRAEAASAYLDARGERVLAALEQVAAAHSTTIAAVALAWLAAQPTVTAPIASARTVEQLRELLPVAGIRLAAGEIAELTQASDA